MVIHQLRDLIVHIPRNAFIHWVLKNVPVSRRRRGATAGWLAACLCHRQDRTGQEMKRPFKGDTRGEQVSRTRTRRTKPSKHVWYQDRTKERLQRFYIKNVGKKKRTVTVLFLRTNFINLKFFNRGVVAPKRYAEVLQKGFKRCWLVIFIFI